MSAPPVQKSHAQNCTDCSRYVSVCRRRLPRSSVAVRRCRPEPAESRSQDAPERRAAAARREVSRGDRADGRRWCSIRSTRSSSRRLRPSSAFFLEQDVKSKRMVGFVVEKRKSAIAQAAFDLGPLRGLAAAGAGGTGLGAAPGGGRREREGAARGDLRDRRHRRRCRWPADQVARLTKALDHYDPAVRAAAARVIGRLKVTEDGRRAAQGGQRFAGRRALRGDARARRDPRGARRRRADRAVRVLQEGRGRVVRAGRAGADRRAGERRRCSGSGCRTRTPTSAAPRPKASVAPATPSRSTPRKERHDRRGGDGAAGDGFALQKLGRNYARPHRRPDVVARR